MKKRMVCALMAILVFAAIPSFAEDMPVIAWETPAPAQETVMQTGEITDSWEEIIAAIDDGSASQRYAVGATKALDLGDLGTVHMQLAGFDLDERADGQGNAATTWIAVELLPERRCMNEDWENPGGWQTSDLRKYLQDTVLPAIPSPIRQHIISVVKRQQADGKSQTTEETVWIPNFEEVFGNTALYYGLFQDKDENRVKNLQGSTAWWWLRSSHTINSAAYVYSDGSNDSTNVSYSGGVALGFCLDTPAPAPEIVIQTGEITDSWEEIIAAIDDGSASLRYAVGATKALDLGDLGTVHMQLAGFDLDDRADGQGKAATTWIAVELLPESRRMNVDWKNPGGWRDSDLRKYLQNTVLPALPSPIRQHIHSVNKSQWADGEWQTTEEILWIPDHDEVFGDAALYYGLFQDRDENRVKYLQDSAAWWWLRSAYYYTSNIFYGVGSGGSGTYSAASNEGGVPLGFCL